MAERFGADTGRLYTLFAAPPEKDLEWSEESIEGSWRFLNRVFRLIAKHAPDYARATLCSGAACCVPAWQDGSYAGTHFWNLADLTEREKSLLRKTHQTLRRVTQDFETRWHFNSAIA